MLCVLTHACGWHLCSSKLTLCNVAYTHTHTVVEHGFKNASLAVHRDITVARPCSNPSLQPGCIVPPTINAVNGARVSVQCVHCCYELLLSCTADPATVTAVPLHVLAHR